LVPFFLFILLGGYCIRIGEKYINFPKTATLMVPALLLAGLFQEGSLADIPFLFYTGLSLLLTGFMSFFPKRRPTNPIEAQIFITMINDKKEE
jgi:hypothetical protein